MKKGLYEQLIDHALQQELNATELSNYIDKLDPADSHEAVAAHLVAAVRGVLRRQPVKDRLKAQATLANSIFKLLGEFDPDLNPEDLKLSSDLKILLAVYDTQCAPTRTVIPAATNSLFTAGHAAMPSLISELKRELETADTVDILCSFIKWSGIAMLQDSLEKFLARSGTTLRVITTTYMGATDFRAVEMLAELPNTEVKVSYDTRHTRLHAKAYMFQRDTKFSTAYIGSANISRPALTEGLEWNLKVTQYSDPSIWKQMQGTFNTYWNHPEFKPYESDRLKAALENEGSPHKARDTIISFDLNPYPFQQEILDTLENDRELNSPPHRQLVVAATGTGKTMVAAFDYKREVKKNGGRYPTLLFVAHRREILEQSLASFRAVLKNQNFGDILDGSSSPRQHEHLFATIQTVYSRDWIRKLPPDKFSYIVIDETHRSAAESYQTLLNHAKPHILLGLTATPERTDGDDILRYFGNRIVSELRLPDAINLRLVAPFHYYAAADDVDYTRARWERGSYRTSDIDKLLTGNDARAGIILNQCLRRLKNPHEARGLGFCVSVEHANFMAAFFNKHNIKARSLSSNTPTEERRRCQAELSDGTLNFLFVVDLYNEGVDIPEIDTVLFLRPTESLTVFLQQLGRGLRITDGKDYLTVLDFVGQMHQKFRFDRRLQALIAQPKQDLIKEIEQGFPHLPAGCMIELERVASERIVANIKSSLLMGKAPLVRDIAEFESETGKVLNFASFLTHYNITPEDIYQRASWSRLLSEAGVAQTFESPEEDLLRKWLRRIAHANDIMRLRRWSEWLADGQGDDPLILALALPLLTEPGVSSAADVWQLLKRNPVLLREARSLVEWLMSQPTVIKDNKEKSLLGTELVLHASYTRGEVLVLTGSWTWEKRAAMREGVRHLPERKLDLFFSTLDKTEKNFSPTTMYEDYAIDEHQFHWQSQSTTSEESPTGQRYIHHEKRGYTPLMFVREKAKVNGYAEPFAYLGPLTYMQHEGSRPMSVIWRVRHAIPARLLRVAERLAVA